MLNNYQWYLVYSSFTVTVSIMLMFGAQMKMLEQGFNIPEGYFKWVLVVFLLANGLSRYLPVPCQTRSGGKIQ